MFWRKKKQEQQTPPQPSSISKPASEALKAAQPKLSLLSLESRLMFDAAATATASEVASEQVAQEQAEAAVSSDHHADGPSAEQTEAQGVLDAIATYNLGESRSEVVFVDPTVPNYQDLLSGMDPNVEVIMLDGGQDGVEQMANALSGRTGIDAIHVISHGEAGALQLGTGVLNADSMSTDYADDLAVIQQSLSEQADILVYGCEFAKGDAGQTAVDMLAQLTGADVQASTDLTGSISLGGDWEFETSTGTIETSLAIDYGAQMNWAAVLGNETVADTFSDKSYGNNDGTSSWSSNWSEVDRGGSDANGGHIKVNSGELRIETQVVGASVSRGVDLSSARSATLSFEYDNNLDKSGAVEVRISTDGGANYRTLTDGMFSKTSNTGSGTASFDISDHMSADTKIQFVVTGTSGGDRLFIDNVQVDYHVADVNTAPTDLALSASSVAEQAVTGTVVGTVSGTDPDASDTKSYSLTDTAGGRFAIDPSSGVLTVADGSLLNYEAAASHSVTVQVTDSGGQSYTETFTINLTNVNEGPSDLALSASSVAEQAVTGTVVGTVSGTDPDASDTKSYSLTDTAGGRFAIDPSSGVLTVADGSLLNYEAAASHSVTVQVTDSGGQSYTETFTINLTNVNEGPSSTGQNVDDSPESNTVIAVLGDTKLVAPAVERANAISEVEVRPLDGLGMSTEVRSEPSAIVAPAKDLSHLAHTAVVEWAAILGGKQNVPASSGKRERIAVNLDATGNQDVARLESHNPILQDAEEMETTSDESSGLDMPMAAGLAGMMMLPGRTELKDKMTVMSRRIRGLPQGPPSDAKPGESNEDQDGSRTLVEPIPPKVSPKSNQS